jgi:uncharacterized protein (DUF433 family)
MKFVSVAEAAYIGGLTAQQMSRAAEELLVPVACFKRTDEGWLFDRWGAALASFYFSTEAELDADERRFVMDQLAHRVAQLSEEESGLTEAALKKVDWKVECMSAVVDATPWIRPALARAKEVDLTHTLVTNDPQIMGGRAVFSGTRVPLEFVLSSLDQSAAFNRLKDVYPFLTVEHIQAARAYEAIHPRRSRPRRLSEVNAGLPRRVLRSIPNS